MRDDDYLRKHELRSSLHGRARGAAVRSVEERPSGSTNVDARRLKELTYTVSLSFFSRYVFFHTSLLSVPSLRKELKLTVNGLACVLLRYVD